jgi:hypothetical protein
VTVNRHAAVQPQAPLRRGLLLFFSDTVNGIAVRERRIIVWKNYYNVLCDPYTHRATVNRHAAVQPQAPLRRGLLLFFSDTVYGIAVREREIISI